MFLFLFFAHVFSEVFMGLLHFTLRAHVQQLILYRSVCEETLKVVATVFKKFLVVYGGFSDHILGENHREIVIHKGRYT